MMNNHIYNLMEQVVQENKSLWRIEKNYPTDSGDCDPCKSFWARMKKDKEEHIEELLGMIKEHLA